MIVTLWVIQALLNLALGFFAFQWLVARKRMNWMEAEIEMLHQKQSSQSVAVLEAPKPEPTKDLVAETKNQNASQNHTPHSNLVERRVSQEPRKVVRPGAEAYERADSLLARGTPLPEVARQTGLSIAELQLLGKVTHRVH